MKILSWGSNSHGQLAQNLQEEQTILPTLISLNLQAVQVTGGGKHSVLVTSNNEILTCGHNDNGQLGCESFTNLIYSFQLIPCQYKITKVSCGWDFNLALTDNQDVLGWGSNSYGQLGLSVNKVSYLSSPLKVFDKKGIDISAGLRHSGIVTCEGFIFMCGYGNKGQLGFYVNSRVPEKVDKFTQVKEINDCAEVTCGEIHTVVKNNKGKIFAWGSNKFGQLGVDPSYIKAINTPEKIDVPVEDSKENSLHSGWAHNLILTEKGQVISWGRNNFGQIGDQREDSWKPKIIESLKEIKQIACGSHHCIALTSAGDVFTWGWNEHGNCGNGTCENVKEPQKVKTLCGKVEFVGSGAAHCFVGFDKMSELEENVILEIKDPTVNPTPYTGILTEIPIIEPNIEYFQFFEQFLLPNKPCVIKNISQKWNCTSSWLKNNRFNINYFKNNYKNTEVPISNCGKREYNVQQKCSMKLFDYLDYWVEYKNKKEEMDCFYLKDWHFVKEYPNEDVYRVPHYFASDWLNEYYDHHSELNDDYKFVYIGPKGSWTPFHADVFISYSWSVNISGRKKWILIPPGAEKNFVDDLGNLSFDIDLSKIKNDEPKFPIFEVIQEEGQGIFVPSGWHHQVWNLEDTISINHNWFNGCNIHHVWDSLKKNLSDVMKEIEDCRDMDDWVSQCQIVLSASFGMNYQFFHSFLVEIAKSRMEAVKSKNLLQVNGHWRFGENHSVFDLRQILKILKSLEKDSCFEELVKIDNNLNHSLEFIDSLNFFLNS